MKYTIDEIQEILYTKLKKSRYRHILGVQYTSVCLAMRYDADIELAEIAGLLHDCAKELPDKQLIEICRTKGEKISKTEFKNPFLLHGKAGACMAQNEFGVKDETVLNAIRYHTTGRPDMSILEKIVFVADYIEPGRKKAENLRELRRLAFEDLDAALLHILEQTLEYLKTTGSEIDNQTVVTRNYYNELLRGVPNEHIKKNGRACH